MIDLKGCYEDALLSVINRILLHRPSHVIVNLQDRPTKKMQNIDGVKEKKIREDLSRRLAEGVRGAMCVGHSSRMAPFTKTA